MASGASISRSWLCGLPVWAESPVSLNRLNESLLGGPQTPGQSGMPGRLHHSSVSRTLIEPVFQDSLLKTRIGRTTTKNAIRLIECLYSGSYHECCAPVPESEPMPFDT